MFAVSCSHVVHAVLSVARFDPHFGAWCPSKKANVYRDCCDPLISNSKKWKLIEILIVLTLQHVIVSDWWPKKISNHFLLMFEIWLSSLGLGVFSLLVYQNVSQVLLPAELSSASYYPNYIKRCTRFGTSSHLGNRIVGFYNFQPTVQVLYYTDGSLSIFILHVHSTCFEYSVHIIWLYIHGDINICMYIVMNPFDTFLCFQLYFLQLSRQVQCFPMFRRRQSADDGVWRCHGTVEWWGRYLGSYGLRGRKQVKS